MKSIPALLAATLILLTASLRAELLLQPGDMVAICGDSITEQKMYSVYM